MQLLRNKKLTPDEIKQAKRNKRRYKGERMHHNLLMEKEDSNFNDSVFNTSRNKTDNYLYSDSKNFEKNLNKFLNISIADDQFKKSGKKSEEILITFENEEDNSLNKVSSDNKIKPDYVLPEEEKKLPTQLETEVSNLANDENSSLSRSSKTVLYLRKKENISNPVVVSKVSINK